MILRRYFFKEVYAAVFSVTLILVLIFLVNQTIRFLTQAATGHLAANAVLDLIGLELPYLLGLLLPLGLYLGILITYSRFYADQEMTVLFSSGMSEWQLLRITLFISSIAFIIACMLMFFVNPFLAQKKNAILESTTMQNVVAALVPGTFKISQGGKRVIYVSDISRDHKIARNIFIAEAPIKSVAATSNLAVEHPIDWSITSAQKGYQHRFGENKQMFIVAENGYRYQGEPGKQNFSVTQYKQYAIALPQESDNYISTDSDALPTLQLIANPNHQLRYHTELEWRLGLPISAVLLAILAQFLSRVEPRHGRFQRLIPAILIYIVYANMLFVGRNWMYHAKTPEWLGIWWVHAALAVFILFLGYKKLR